MDYESIEVRRVKNGVIVALRTEDEDSEFVFDSNRKALKFVKDLLDGKIDPSNWFYPKSNTILKHSITQYNTVLFNV